MKRIALLGATGSIGESTLRVVDALPQEFQIVALGAHHNWQRLLAQAQKYQVKTIALADPIAAKLARQSAPAGLKVLSGEEGLIELASMPEVDIVVMALVGMAGLKPSLAAIEAKHDIALATKEVLVSAGEIVMQRRAEMGVRILPVDSEHAAIFQAMQSAQWTAACVRTKETLCAEDFIDTITLTASGGPFANRPELDLSTVTVQQAMMHPTWSMGSKVTIDSATMMNKGLELIEAHWLFNIPVARIKTIIHPESIIHSLITYRDGNTLAQLSPPDMCFPIQYALTHPRRCEVSMPQLDLLQQTALHFSQPDEKRFPALALARYALQVGGTAPTVLNAANEVAVAQFIEGKITFDRIPALVERALEVHTPRLHPSLEEVLAVDQEIRQELAYSV